MAQRFYNLVLLPRVRDDIAEYKRLNFHLYMALKKALFKPGAWFKGKRKLRCRRGWADFQHSYLMQKGRAGLSVCSLFPGVIRNGVGETWVEDLVFSCCLWPRGNNISYPWHS